MYLFKRKQETTTKSHPGKNDSQPRRISLIKASGSSHDGEKKKHGAETSPNADSQSGSERDKQGPDQRVTVPAVIRCLSD